LLATAIEIAVARLEGWRELEREAKSLQETLSARQMVDQAKRVLMERYGLTEEAFTRSTAKAGRAEGRCGRWLRKSCGRNSCLTFLGGL
jgi:hypothetical protein